MKTFTRIIILLIVANLITSVSVTAQSQPSEGANSTGVQESQPDMTQREAEVAAKLAQRQAEIAQKQAEAVQKQAELAAAMAQTQPQIPDAPTPPSLPSTGRLKDLSAMMMEDLTLSLGRQSSGTAILVIPSAEMTTEELVSVNEDLNVMSRIFQSNLEKARISPVGTSLLLSEDRIYGRFLGAERNAIQSMYLQGYGVLFLMKVDFPLLPAAEPKQEEKAEEQEAEKTDPVWDRTRRELYEPKEVEREKSDEPKEQYDAEKVENLKTALVQALKHAANIRSLKPNESIIITVAGAGGTAGSNVSKVSIMGKNIILTERHDGGAATTKVLQGASPDDIGLSSSAILVIRAKKSDVDAFANGELDDEKFGQCVQMLTCPYIGARAGQGNAFPFNYRRF